jgi:hypothetical protein
LLTLLRPDSVGSVTREGGTTHVQFSGIDGYAYGVQISSNLSAWTTVSTNYPKDGFFDFRQSSPVNSSRRFYRSVLMP